MQNDPAGPNPASTKIEEDTSITYIHSKEVNYCRRHHHLFFGPFHILGLPCFVSTLLSPFIITIIIISAYLHQHLYTPQLADQDDDPLSKLKGKMVMCRICKGDHWTTKCPYKDSLVPLQESNSDTKKEEQPAHQLTGSSGQSSAQKPGKYIPPSMREGGNKKGESMSMRSRGGRWKLFVGNILKVWILNERILL